MMQSAQRRREADAIAKSVARRCSPSSHQKRKAPSTPDAKSKRRPEMALTQEAWRLDNAEVPYKKSRQTTTPLLDEFDPSLGTEVTRDTNKEVPANMRTALQRICGALHFEMEATHERKCKECGHAALQEDLRLGRVVCHKCGCEEREPILDARPPPSSGDHATAASYADMADPDLSRVGTRAVLNHEQLATEFLIIGARLHAFGLAEPLGPDRKLQPQHGRRATGVLSTRRQARIRQTVARRVVGANPAPSFARTAARMPNVPSRVRKVAQKLMDPQASTKRRLSRQSYMRNLTMGTDELEELASHFKCNHAVLQSAKNLWKKYCDQCFSLNLRHYNRACVAVPAVLFYVIETHGASVTLHQLTQHVRVTYDQIMSQCLRLRDLCSVPAPTLQPRLYGVVMVMSQHLHHSPHVRLFSLLLTREVYLPQFKGLVPQPWRRFVDPTTNTLRGPLWEAMLSHHVAPLAAALVYLSHARHCLTHRYASNRVNQPGASSTLVNSLPRHMDLGSVKDTLVQVCGPFCLTDMQRFAKVFSSTADTLLGCA